MAALASFAETGAAQADLDGASAAIRRYCGWRIWPRATEVLVVNGSGNCNLMLPTLKLNGVSAILERWQWDAEPLVVDPDSVEWSEAGWLRKLTPWTWRLRGVTVTVDHGYDEVPDLAALCVDLAARVSAGPAGIVRQSAGMRSVEYQRAMTAADHGVLDLYRRVD